MKNNTTFFYPTFKVEGKKVVLFVIFYPTFKVEGKKVVLFFHFEQKWKSYGHFQILKLSLFEIKILKWENGHKWENDHKFPIRISNFHFQFNFEFSVSVWGWSLKSKFKVDVLDPCLKLWLKFGIEGWSWNRIQFKAEFWSLT